MPVVTPYGTFYRAVPRGRWSKFWGTLETICRLVVAGSRGSSLRRHRIISIPFPLAGISLVLIFVVHSFMRVLVGELCVDA